MKLEATFLSRDFSRMRLLENTDQRVNSMHWNAIGGCTDASITLFGPVEDLWEAIELLRCPVTIRDEKGMAAWWGYVTEAQVRVGAIEIGATLSSMQNKVAVAYSYIQPGTQTVGQRKTTSWATDADSIAEYGTKEFLSSQGGLSDAAAEAKRAAILASRRWPQGSINPFGAPRGRVRYSGAENSQSATLLCSGWWDTLTWRHASIPSVVGPSYQTTSATEQAVGSSSSNTKVMEVIAPGTQAINAITLAVYAKKSGSPTDNFTLSLYAASDADEPVGSVLASGTVAGTSLTTSFAWITVTLTVEEELPANADFCLQVSRSGAADASNYYIINVNEALGYTSGLFKIYNGSAWVARSPDADMPFVITVNNKVASTQQIRDLVTLFGEFITAVSVEEESGILLPSYRDGDTIVQDELVELMECGGANSRRLLALVDIDRRLRVWEEPANTDCIYRLNRYGELLDRFYTPVDEYAPPVGVWCRLTDVIPANADVSKLNTPELQFIEGAQWSTDNGLMLQFRGQPGIDDLLKFGR